MDICGVFTSKPGQLQLRASNDLGQSFGRGKCSEMARIVPAGQRRIIAPPARRIAFTAKDDDNTMEYQLAAVSR